MRWVLALSCGCREWVRSGFLVLAGCGRLQFDAQSFDAQSFDANLADAAPDCWAAWRSGPPTFTPPAPVIELADPDKQGNPWLSADGLTLYFDSGTGDTELFRASRPARDQPFGPRVAIPELTTPVEDTGLVLTADGLRGVISSSRAGGAGFDLWQVDRADPAALFGTPTRAPYAAINTGNNQYDAYLTPDGLRVYYAENTVPGQVLRVSARASVDAAFLAPAAVPGAATFAVEADPDLSPDERVMVFSAQSAGLLQLFTATRAEPTLPFSLPMPLTAISPTGLDADPAFSADGCELFFISNRGGDRDLWRTTVVP